MWYRQVVESVVQAGIFNQGGGVETFGRISTSMLSLMTRLRKAEIHTFVKSGSFITIIVCRLWPYTTKTHR